MSGGPPSSAARLPPDARRRQLLEIATREFAEHGFHNTSMDGIARAAGITKPVIYQHFESKRALFTEVLEDVGRRIIDALREATSQATTGRARVQAGFAAYFHFVARNRDAFRILFGTSARNDPESTRVVDTVLDAVARSVLTLIEIRGTKEHRRVLAHAIVGMAESMSRYALGPPGAMLDPDQLAQWGAELAWSGLRGIRPEERSTRS